MMATPAKKPTVTRKKSGALDAGMHQSLMRQADLLVKKVEKEIKQANYAKEWEASYYGDQKKKRK